MKNAEIKNSESKASILKKHRPLAVIILSVLILAGMCFFAAGEDYLAVSLDYLLDVFKPQIMSEMSFQVVNVPKGDRFYGGEGCEFILRGGTGIIRASAQGGVNDATEGADLWGGLPVPPHHLLIIPRDDGRGFVAETDVIIMVKGKYYIGK